jgi:hypothetical protein
MLQPQTTLVYKEVALLIAPTDTPAWLSSMLSDWAPSIALDRAVHEAQPTKVEMRKRLAQIQLAAATLLHSFQHAPTKEFLEREGAIRIENFGGLEHTLRTIGERAATAAVSTTISETLAKAKKGTGKALPAISIPPKAFCALIVAEVWKHVRGNYPAMGSKEAATAAEAYWCASGGSTKSWGTQTHRSWSYHFRKARTPAAEQLRREVCRHCMENAHLQQVLSQNENN